MFNTIIYYLVSLWIWGITFDLSHIALSMILLFCSFFCIAKIGILRSLGLSIALPILSFALYTGIIIGGVVDFLQWEYVPLLDSKNIRYITHEHALLMCVLFAAVQIVLQIMLLCSARLFVKFSLFKYSCVIMLGNIVAALVSYYIGIRLFMWYAFT